MVNGSYSFQSPGTLDLVDVSADLPEDGVTCKFGVDLFHVSKNKILTINIPQ